MSRGRHKSGAGRIVAGWLVLAGLGLTLYGAYLFGGCRPGDCLVERTMLVWTVAAAVPVTLAVIAVHLWLAVRRRRQSSSGNESSSED